MSQVGVSFLHLDHRIKTGGVYSSVCGQRGEHPARTVVAVSNTERLDSGTAKVSIQGGTVVFSVSRRCKPRTDQRVALFSLIDI